MRRERLTVPIGECVFVRGVLVHETVIGRVTGLLSHCPEVKLTSGWRSVAHNAEVGGVRRSRHLSGCAIDIVGSHQQLSLLAAQGPRHQAIEVIYEVDHLHVGFSRPS